MDIDKTINQKVTTAVEEVTEKVEKKILVVQSKSEDENNQIDISTQARSQDLKKGGGLFWKSEKCAYDVDSNFHWPWISFRRFVRNLRRNVSETSEIQRFFPPKIRWSPKKKKKRSSPKFRVIFLPSFASSIVWGGALFVWGGLFSIFHRKSASKAQNTCVFAYFTSQCPPPGYATVSTPLSKLKTTLEEVTLLSDRIQTLETVLQARANNQIRQEHSTRDWVFWFMAKPSRRVLVKAEKKLIKFSQIFWEMDWRLTCKP